MYVYRLLSSGTIEEKVFQRQISKEGAQGPGAGGGARGRGRGPWAMGREPWARAGGAPAVCAA